MSGIDAFLRLLGAPRQEDVFVPSYRIKIIAHASPRWLGAGNPRDAARLNRQLSERRARAVRKVIENTFLSKVGSLREVSFALEITEMDGTLGVDEEARGSSDTLVEARGNRMDNNQSRRRVNVSIRTSQRRTGVSGISKMPDFKYEYSRLWYVSVDMSATASAGGTGQLLVIRLINYFTGVSMNARVWAVGGGPEVGVGAGISIWSEPTLFNTDEPVTFSDFEGAWIRYSNFGVNLFIGYEKARISFMGFGPGAQDLDVGGAQLGTVGVGGAVTFGKVKPEAIPDDRTFIDGTDEQQIPYSASAQGAFEHAVLFDTERDVLTSIDSRYLASMVETAIASSLPATR